MRNRKLATLALSATALVGALAAAPVASADTTATTPVTFTLTTTGTLSITAPTAQVTLDSSGALDLVNGSSVSKALGSTTVTDSRAALLHNLTVKMEASDFVQKDSGNNVVATVSRTNAKAYSGTASGSLTSLAAPTTALTAPGIGVDGGATILTVTGVVGSGTVSYNPTVSVSIPGSAAAGTYTGTVTQTVS